MKSKQAAKSPSVTAPKSPGTAQANTTPSSPSLIQEILPLRQASREMVRELGFMQGVFTPAGMPHSHCHTLMETELCGALSQNELSERLCLEKSTMSRIVAQLVAQGLLQVESDSVDKRRNRVSLTPAGRAKLEEIHRGANAQVLDALDQLSPDERATVLAGIRLYAKALQRARRQSPYTIEAIAPADAAGMAAVIRKVMPEFGASGPGFAIHDPEVDEMYAAYQAPGCAYFVVRRQGRVVGGGGVAPLAGGDRKTCELRKMYFLPELRGLGLGRKLMNRCLDSARALGYSHCYLETLESMKQARALYAKNGFEPLAGPLGDTGHFGCDAWYLKPLNG